MSAPGAQSMNNLQHPPAEHQLLLSAVLEHPRMPAYLRSTFLDLQAREQGSGFWDWSNDEAVLQAATARIPVLLKRLFASLATTFSLLWYIFQRAGHEFPAAWQAVVHALQLS